MQIDMVGKKLKNIDVRIGALIFLFIGMGLFATLNLSISSTNKEYSTFQSVDGNYETIDVKKSEIEYRFIPKFNNIKKYWISTKKDTSASGQIDWEIYSQGVLVFKGNEKIEEVIEKEKIVLSFEEIPLKKGVEYEIKLRFDLEESINLFWNGKELMNTQVFVNNEKLIVNSMIWFIFILNMIILCIIICKKNIIIERVFLGMALCYGLIFLILLPPLNALDENRHFYRAYDISQGNFISKEKNDSIRVAYMPSEYREISEVGNIENLNSYKFELNEKIQLGIYSDEFKKQLSGETQEFSLQATADIHPIAYAPQVIGILISRILKFSPIMVMYMGRLFNFLFWTIMIYFSIKIVPKYKLLFLLIALIPTNIHLAASCSTDGVLNSLSMVFIALIYNIKYTKRQMEFNKYIVIFTAFGIIFSLIKLPYVLLLLLIIILENKNILQVHKKMIMTIVPIGIGILMYLLWNHANTPYLPIQQLNDAGMGEYIKYVLVHPFDFIRLVISDLQNINSYAENLVGKIGWGNSPKQYFMIYTYLFVLGTIGILTPNKKIINTNKDYIKIISIFLVIYTSIIFVGFTWKPINYGSIWGIHGRYFIPLVPLILTSMSINIKISNEKKLNKIVMLFTNWCMINSVFYLIQRYWI